MPHVGGGYKSNGPQVSAYLVVVASGYFYYFIDYESSIDSMLMICKCWIIFQRDIEANKRLDCGYIY